MACCLQPDTLSSHAAGCTLVPLQLSSSSTTIAGAGAGAGGGGCTIHLQIQTIDDGDCSGPLRGQHVNNPLQPHIQKAKMDRLSCTGNTAVPDRHWEGLIIEQELTCLEGLSPSIELSVEDLASILYKCRKEKDQGLAMRLHVCMCASGLEVHPSLGNYLVSMLVDSGRILDAHRLFDKLAIRKDCSWNSLISGYLRSGEPRRAFLLYQKMQEDDTAHPSQHTFVGLIKAAAQLKDLDRGCQIHVHLARMVSWEENVFVGTSLISMYAKCGCLERAQEVFDKLLVRNAVSWTALIAGYVQDGNAEEALKCYDLMQLEGLCPTAHTFTCSLKACGIIGAIDKGREIHAEICKKPSLEEDAFVGAALIDMYAKCGLLENAQQAFDKLPVRDVVSWTALIDGYAEHGHCEKALNCYKQMQVDGISPNAHTFVCSLKACGNLQDLHKGKEIHDRIIQNGSLISDPRVGTALVTMYAKCASLAKAQEVFDELPARNLFSWNAIMDVYMQHGHAEETLNCFDRMRLEGVSPDVVTFTYGLKACRSLGAVGKCQEIHDEISLKGLLEKDPTLGTLLIDMYAKSGLLVKAQEVFDKLRFRDHVCWTALIAGYAQYGHGKEALNCFQQMRLEGISPDAISFLCCLKACSCIGATDKGQEIHAELSRNGLLQKDFVLGTALVDMYAKFGQLEKAQEVFDKLQVRDVVAWTALIAGYAQQGETAEVFSLFDRMTREGIKPNLATFLSVLSACNHAGLVDKGQMYYQAMSNDYSIVPTVEHHTCMVDLLSRAGQLDKVVEMIRKVPGLDNIVVWLIVLGACQKWGNVEFGRRAFERVVQLDKNNSTAYVCMANIYSDSGMQELADEIEAMRVKRIE